MVFVVTTALHYVRRQLLEVKDKIGLLIFVCHQMQSLQAAAISDGAMAMVKRAAIIILLLNIILSFMITPCF